MNKTREELRKTHEEWLDYVAGDIDKMPDSLHLAAFGFVRDDNKEEKCPAK